MAILGWLNLTLVKEKYVKLSVIISYRLDTMEFKIEELLLSKQALLCWSYVWRHVILIGQEKDLNITCHCKIINKLERPYY